MTDDTSDLVTENPLDEKTAPENSLGTPRFTVVTPSFNQGAFLEQTILSVLDQNYPNLQYIVVDGGSTDQSSEILDRYADRITTIIREPDQGQSDAIRKGLELADGDFFNWINSDDRLMPGILRQMVSQCRESTDLFTFPVRVFGEGVTPYLMRNENLSAIAILRDDRYSFSQPGLWFRTEKVRQCGGIDTSFNFSFDWDLLLRYLASFPRVQYGRAIGAEFRLHETSKTNVEFGKVNAQGNRFLMEAARVRDKLEASLPPSLSRASKLGRVRKPWNERLIRALDDRESSPLVSAAGITRDMLKAPRSRVNTRSFGTLARLLSRYFRPKSSIGKRS